MGIGVHLSRNVQRVVVSGKNDVRKASDQSSVGLPVPFICPDGPRPFKAGKLNRVAVSREIGRAHV